ncbi:hypothetical protein ABE65_005010 [Fictibacillus phosphorivorans]|uniref:Uncharacterized protein n=1 Tax=Fictibacillus phosphorivorans TaxID=1221500 RepID=A0A160ILG4_9BACL|nr:hypothetical protein [Fictibacillus phosphorivorans]ANC76202.1 hypothetical protein ABE65_005010 [Fictibacillus phosphorivorans]
MDSNQYVKRSSFLLLSIFPVLMVGYYFAVNHENLFFLYEWMLIVVVLGAGLMSLIGAIKTKEKEKWVLLSIIAFCVQFAVLATFLGPLTFYPMFFLYYTATILAMTVFGITLSKVDNYRYISVIFMIISVLLTVYMIILQSLWGQDLT